jgi:hypothetical protein
MSTKTTTTIHIWEGAKCHRCGRNSHTKNTCYAKTDISGNELKPTIVTTEVIEKPKSLWSKLTNEFTNPDSDLRSGRFMGLSPKTDCSNSNHK